MQEIDRPVVNLLKLPLYLSLEPRNQKGLFMPVIVIILAILFATLIIGIPLIEKYSKEKSSEELQKITRYMTPLMIVLLIAAAFRYFIS
jgi:chromate transport protein ChrA